MAVAWDKVRAALAVGLKGPLEASGVVVYDGPVVTGQAPTAYLTVAHAPTAIEDTSGTFEQDVGPDGFSVTERGGVVCELAGVTGSTKVPSVFASFDVIAEFIQSDQTLGGVLTHGSTVTALANVVESQTTSGAVQRLLITISYFTRLP